MSDAPSEPATQASPHPFLRVERAGEVQTVTLTNPSKRNAQTPSLWRALAEVAAQTPDEVRVVVLRGEGQSFSAGLDRQMLAPGGVPGEPDMMAVAAGSAQAMEALIEDFQRGFTAWAQLPAVVVAAVQGHAIGA
ncbi:MAG: enoyl-CoA hydratase/isomerase family protein, partial [Lapillicoccus sp.]